MQKLQGWVEQGNTTLSIGGASGVIARKVQGSFPSATVTVYISDPQSIAISAISRTSNVVTVTIPANSGFISGQLVTIASVTDSSFNGVFTIALSDSTTFTYAQTAANGSSSGGTALSTLRFATIYSDNDLTQKANPFTSSSNSSWFFYAPNGAYDVKFSGGGITAPFTIGGLWLFDEAQVWTDVKSAPYFAHGDGVTDDTSAFNAALAASKTLLLPPGNYVISSSLALTSGTSIIAVTQPQRWRSNVFPVRLSYSGTGALFTVTPGSSAVIDTVYISGIQMDGTNASGAVDGLLLDASASGSAIEGVYVENCGITNFPQSQVHSKNTVFDITFRHCSLHNSGRSVTGDTVKITTTVAAAPGQWTFDDCWILQYTASLWTIFAGRNGSFPSNAISELRLINGTIGPAASNPGASGVWVYGGLVIMGTHMENAQESTQSATIGIRYTGGNGALIAPSTCSFFGTGLEVGDSTNTVTDAEGCIVLSGIGFNLTAGNDIHVIGTGSRRGNVIFPMGSFPVSGSFGQTGGLIKVTNDGSANDLIQLQNAGSGANPTFGPLVLDAVNSRLGIGGTPAVGIDLWTVHNSGYRVTNTSNSNRIAAQVLADGSNIGSVTCYDSSEVQKAFIKGDGTGALSTAGSAAADASAILTLTSTTKGFLPPQMTTAQRNAISFPTAGLTIYNTDTGTLNMYNGAWKAVTIT